MRGIQFLDNVGERLAACYAFERFGARTNMYFAIRVHRRTIVSDSVHYVGQVNSSWLDTSRQRAALPRIV